MNKRNRSFYIGYITMQVPNSTDFGISIEKTFRCFWYLFQSLDIVVLKQRFLLINGKNSSRGKDSGWKSK